MAQIRKLENYLKGLKDGTGIGIAYIPFGVAIGLISAKSFSQILPMIGLTSFGMYAGGAHSLLLKVLYVMKSPPVEVIVSIGLINLRYLLLNIVIFRQLGEKTPIFQKFLVGVGLTDETVTYLTLKKAKNAWYMMGVNTIPYFCYCFGTIFGAIFGEKLPESLMTSMNFVLYSIFFSMLIMALSQNFKYIRIVLLALIIKMAFAFLPILNKVSSGWVMILTMFLASFIYAQLYYNENPEKQENDEIDRKKGSDKVEL